MPLTITAHYTFIPNTGAQSAQVNNNFDNLRGTKLPLTDNTATASDNLYDLGSADYRFANVYCSQNVYLGTPNTAGGWRIVVGATTTQLVFEYYSSSSYVTKMDINA